MTHKTEVNVNADQQGIATAGDASFSGSSSAKGGNGGSANISLNSLGDRSHEITASSMANQLEKKDKEITDLRKELNDSYRLLTAYEGSFLLAKANLLRNSINIPKDYTISDYILDSILFINDRAACFHDYVSNKSVDGGEKS